jgi:hypothetical protein
LSDLLRSVFQPTRPVWLPLNDRHPTTLEAVRPQTDYLQQKLEMDELSVSVESLSGYAHNTEEIWGGDELAPEVRRRHAGPSAPRHKL